MRHLFAVSCLLALCACGPTSKFQDYTTPERAARSYVEAGRVGDMAALRNSVVAEERDWNHSADYGDMGEYSIQLDQTFEDERAICLLNTGPLQTPIACVKEGAEWKVSVRGTLHLMQQMVTNAMPR